MLAIQDSIKDKIVNNALKHPHRDCFVIKNEVYSYLTAIKTSLRWESFLRTQEKEGNLNYKRIGIFGYKSAETYLGILTAVMMGVTFVPLNPRFPKSKLIDILKEADLDIIITDEKNHSILTAISVELERESLGRLNIFSPYLLKEENFKYQTSQKEANDIAYIMFTSGSTGKPKGVPISYDNLEHFLKVCQKKYNIEPTDRLTQTFDHTFDLSIFDIFMAWTNAASFYVMDDLEIISPIKFINKNQITIWFSVPSVISLLIKQDILKPNSLPTLRLSLFCGEALYKRHATVWVVAANNSIVENLYGPTELTIACAAYTYCLNGEITNDSEGIVPIGTLFDGLTFKIVDQNNLEVPNGEIGELCVTGPQIFNGYINKSKETKEDLVYLNSTSEKYYKTGDLVQQNDSEGLIYIGRKDTQIKVNGYRMECGEIETRIMENINVLQSVVLPWPIENGVNKGIVAFVVGEQLDSQELSISISKKLPWYMIPDEYVALKVFPLNANGKIDRNALKKVLKERVEKC